MNVKNNGQFKYGNNIAEKWSDDFVIKELGRLIKFLEQDVILNSDILSVSMLLLVSKSQIKTEKQFEYIKYKFKNNDAVSGSFDMIKDLIKNRWLLNGAKNKLNSNITKLVLLNNYDFNNETIVVNQELPEIKPMTEEEIREKIERMVARYNRNKKIEKEMN